MDCIQVAAQRHLQPGSFILMIFTSTQHTAVKLVSSEISSWMSWLTPASAELRARVKNAFQDLSSGSTWMGFSFSAIALWNLQ